MPNTATTNTSCQPGPGPNGQAHSRRRTAYRSPTARDSWSVPSAPPAQLAPARGDAAMPQQHDRTEVAQARGQVPSIDRPWASWKTPSFSPASGSCDRAPARLMPTPIGKPIHASVRNTGRCAPAQHHPGADQPGAQQEHAEHDDRERDIDGQVPDKSAPGTRPPGHRCRCASPWFHLRCAARVLAWLSTVPSAACAR